MIVSQQGTRIKYQAAASADVVVCAQPAILHAIIVGADVGSAVIEVSNHVSDGDGDVQIYIADSNIATKGGIQGIDCHNATFDKGICADLTNQTNVTFIYTQIGGKA